MSVIQKDCFWITVIKNDEEYLAALCSKCNNQEKNSYWMGSENGYGDYDLKCNKCGDVIHQRHETFQEKK